MSVHVRWGWQLLDARGSDMAIRPGQERQCKDKDSAGCVHDPYLYELRDPAPDEGACGDEGDAKPAKYAEDPATIFFGDGRNHDRAAGDHACGTGESLYELQYQRRRQPGRRCYPQSADTRKAPARCQHTARADTPLQWTCQQPTNHPPAVAAAMIMPR